MKGILLAGGLGTRLYPVTLSVSKQLLPIYDKPMIYYSLSVLMQAGIREILLITTEKEVPRFEALLKDGAHLGLSISYAVQKHHEGIAQAFVIAEDFIGNDHVALILGDNIFHGQGLENFLKEKKNFSKGGVIFGYEVADPSRYGVLAFNEKQEIIDIIEKPEQPPSNYAVTGLYFYDNQVINIAKELKPSWRNEYEITDVNKAYLHLRQLKVNYFDPGFAWLDTGTPDAFHKATSYVQAIQERQGIKIACVEKIAYEMGFISLEEFDQLADSYLPSEYGSYLKKTVLKAAQVRYAIHLA